MLRHSLYIEIFYQKCNVSAVNRLTIYYTIWIYEGIFLPQTLDYTYCPSNICPIFLFKMSALWRNNYFMKKKLISKQLYFYRFIFQENLLYLLMTSLQYKHEKKD